MNNEAGAGTHGPSGMSPHDTGASSALRFITEVIAWVVGPWAIASITGTAWTAVPAAIVIIGLSSIFSTPGDKNTVIVATPGPLRLIIELFTIAVAVAGAWIVWPAWAAIVVTALAIGDLVAGMARTKWLARGAPTTER